MTRSVAQIGAVDQSVFGLSKSTRFAVHQIVWSSIKVKDGRTNFGSRCPYVGGRPGRESVRQSPSFGKMDDEARGVRIDELEFTSVGFCCG